MTPMTPQIAAVAALMDEIDQCRNPMPCDLCRSRMQSILDIGAAAERERIADVAEKVMAVYRDPREPDAGSSSFADLLREDQ